MTCRRCSECHGQEHHWLEPEVYAPAGMPFAEQTDEDQIIVQRCKHCDAFRPWDDSEDL